MCSAGGGEARVRHGKHSVERRMGSILPSSPVPKKSLRVLIAVEELSVG